MTPCEELGYEVGDLFIASEGSLFSGGSTVELYRDDGSELPLWRLIEGSCRFDNAGGKPGAYDALDCFTKIKETQDMIVKADGKPYATYGSAKQQLSAKGLGDTHEAVEYLGGYALSRKGVDEEQVTLQPGDYVPTKGMTEDQYRAVAEAFMAAGCRRDHWDDVAGKQFGHWYYLSWDSDGDVLGTDDAEGDTCLPSSRRQLSISQVLNATNAELVEADQEHQQDEGQDAEEDHSTTLDTLRLAQQRVNELSHELSIAQGVRDEALESVRAELGEGFEISVVEGVPIGVDMSDPSNWQEGDIVECVETIDDTRKGGLYTLEVDPSDGELSFKDDVGDWCYVNRTKLRFHSRPTK